MPNNNHPVDVIVLEENPAMRKHFALLEISAKEWGGGVLYLSSDRIAMKYIRNNHRSVFVVIGGYVAAGKDKGLERPERIEKFRAELVAAGVKDSHILVLKGYEFDAEIEHLVREGLHAGQVDILLPL